MFCARGEVGMAGNELPGTNPQLPGDAHPWALPPPLMTTPKETGHWEGGALAIGTFWKEAWRTSAQAEVNMANSKLLGDPVSPITCHSSHMGGTRREETETSLGQARWAKESCWFWTVGGST